MFFRTSGIVIIVSVLLISCIKDEDIDFDKYKNVELENINFVFPLGYDSIKINTFFPSLIITDNDTSRSKMALSFVENIKIIPQEIGKAEIVYMRFRVKFQTFFPVEVLIDLKSKDENDNYIMDLGSLSIQASIFDDFDNELKKIYSTDFETQKINKDDYQKIRTIEVHIHSKEFEKRKLKTKMFLKYGFSLRGNVNYKI